MSCWRLALAGLTATLIGPVPLPGPAAGAGAAPPRPGAPGAVAPGVPLAMVPSAQSAPRLAPVPCPRARPASPPPRRPPGQPPPVDDPAQPPLGGSALATTGLAVPPRTPRPPAVTATSWVVADLDTGEVLGACDAHGYGPPASVLKLLLAATLLPKLDPRQVITVTRADLDFEPGSSAVGLLAGGRHPVRTLWLGLLLSSGNDAANVLARLGGGPAGVGGTVRAMNAEAHRLGALRTHAVTPSGLDGPGQLTTAYDLALIARSCFANEAFRGYVRTERAQIPAQPPRDKHGFQIQNDNQLIFNYPGALGGKSGFTDAARHTYVGAAQRHGRRLVVTLLGAEATPLRGWQQGAALLNWGFAVPGRTGVGHLVTPEQARQATDHAASPAAPASALPRRPGGGPGTSGVGGAGYTWSWGALTGAATVAGGVPLLVVVARRRRVRRGRRRNTR